MKKYLVIIFLSLIAFLNAWYLTQQAYTQSTGSFCDINDKLSCTNVFAAPEARMGPIPFPVIALIVYPVLAFIAYMWYKGKTSKNFKPLSILASMGIAFNGYFIFQEAFVIKSFCPLCLLCTGIIITILILSVIGTKQSN
jgi:uncharacterized membrane protein